MIEFFKKTRTFAHNFLISMAMIDSFLKLIIIKIRHLKIY
jgi:hypothetical protein